MKPGDSTGNKNFRTNALCLQQIYRVPPFKRVLNKMC